MESRLMETILKPAFSISARMAAAWPLRTASGLMMLKVRCENVVLRCSVLFSVFSEKCVPLVYLFTPSLRATGARLHLKIPLIPPARNISPSRSRLRDLLHDLRQIHRVVVQPRERIRQRRIAIPAMFRAVAVLHLALVRHTARRRPRGLQKILHQVNGIVQEVSIRAAYIDVQLALQLRPQRSPVALQLGVQVVVGLPVLGHFVVDLAGSLIEDRLRIAVLTNRRIHRLPDIELFPRAPTITQR